MARTTSSNSAAGEAAEVVSIVDANAPCEYRNMRGARLCMLQDVLITPFLNEIEKAEVSEQIECQASGSQRYHELNSVRVSKQAATHNRRAT